jgi:hypothetical protein
MKTPVSTDMVSSLLTEPLGLEIDIQGIHEPVITAYFASLNHGDFMATAELFAAQGCLNPPFDRQLQGRAAIAQYLAAQAQGIRFLPEYGEIIISDFSHTQYQIQGQVELHWFTINISWSIDLNAAKEIMVVEVKLLASMDELLSFRSI